MTTESPSTFCTMAPAAPRSKARRDGIDANALRSPLERHLLGELRHAGLGGGIRAGIRTGRHAADRRDVDDRTRAALHHATRAQSRDDEHAHEIDVHDALEVLQ